MAKTSTWGIAALAALVICSEQASAATFTFETTASGTALPLTLTNGDVTAAFTGQASVCSATGVFQGLSGNVLIQSFCSTTAQSGAVGIAFSSLLTSASFNFATAGGIGTITVAAFNGNTPTYTNTYTSSVPAGYFNGEGTVSFSAAFTRLTLTPATILAIDNLAVNAAAVPEPASWAMMIAGFGLAGGAIRRKRVVGIRFA